MENKEIILTAEGRQKLIDELAWREGEKDAEIIARIKEAREFGDLSENAEYDAAKEEQAKNAARINEIRNMLNNARVVDAEAVGGMSVSIGCTVELVDAEGKKLSYTIVGTTETNSLARRISNESPAGSAMIGHVVGDTIAFITPTGKVREYTIAGISR